MWILLLVTMLNWIAWFPFLLYDTDWMGAEVYDGKVGDRPVGKLYDNGVRAGTLGLVINSGVLGITSLALQYSKFGRVHPKVGNFQSPQVGRKAGTITLFGIIGLSLGLINVAICILQVIFITIFPIMSILRCLPPLVLFLPLLVIFPYFASEGKSLFIKCKDFCNCIHLKMNFRLMENPVAADLIEYLNASPTALHAVAIDLHSAILK